MLYDINLNIGLLALLVTVYLLIKRYDTRTVLIGAGLFMCLFTQTPFRAFDAFATQMVSPGLIQAICSAMGFAFVLRYTKCDAHLVKLLTASMSKLGLMIIPLAVAMTFLISIAIPSAAGVSAAVGATLIPLLIAARIHPAIAASVVIVGNIGAVLNPGVAHNVQISGYAQTEVIDFIMFHSSVAIMGGVIGALSLTAIAFFRNEHVMSASQIAYAQTEKMQVIEDPLAGEPANLTYALIPFIPVVILVLTSFKLFGDITVTVPAAMLLGAICALVVTRSKPSDVTDNFFNGMGSAFANILGIIIAAAVFIEGLKACGLIDAFIQLIISNPNIARWGGTIGPFIMAAITGTGDATAFAFNQAVTSNAVALGLDPARLGSAALYAACFGRGISPLAGAAIVCAGIAGVNPIEIVKRTALGMILSLAF
ncbi:MAG: C4-dicarboxylate transporter DcuC, partial [Shewanella sp.]